MIFGRISLARRTLCLNYFVVLFCCMFSSSYVGATDSTGIVISFNQQRISPQQLQFRIKAIIPASVGIYPLQKSSEDLLYSTISFDTTLHQYLNGKLKEQGMQVDSFDAVLNAKLAYYTDSVIWQQVFSISEKDSCWLKGRINIMCKRDGQYIPFDKDFRVFVSAASAETAASAMGSYSLLWIFITAFGGGLLALLTPCVYSMIPVTVSFFTKRSRTKAEGIRNALYYSASIIIIFTLLGFLVTLIFGPAALNNLATNWIANLLFFALFVLFGLSFLGAFEISLPASWSLKADSKAGAGSIAGIFFMALTLAVVSFSCTGPIIGNLLVLAAKGSYWGPLTGMFGFSLALAIPFALFAFFPSKLNILGKAGGWLNAVKVSLGFIELALALKFFSNADLAKGWRLLDREIFIALWIVIFALLGIYLMGKIKFHHDDELPKNDFGQPYLSVTRLLFAMTALAFALYMTPGLWGAPLKGISAFVPPMGTQDFNASSGNRPVAAIARSGSEDLHPVKYYEQMKIYEPEVVTKYGMVTYFDYEEALEAARQLKKPLMLDFTGINCVNCRKMEGQVWSDSAVMKRLKKDFVIVSLYVDVHNIDIPPGEQYYSNSLEKQVETLGDLNADLQVSRYGANTQPYYFFIDANEHKLMPDGYGYDPDIQKFSQLLDKVKENYTHSNL